MTLAAALTVAVTATAQRSNTVINSGWKFHAGDMPYAQATDTDDKDWRVVDLPHDFQVEQPWVAPQQGEKADNSDQAANVVSRLSARGFKEMGTGWYRYAFTPADSLRGRRVLIDFEGIMYVGDVYLNGEHVAKTDYGYVGFEVDITQRLRFGQENVIAVKASTSNINSSRWYTGGGLFRDVHLVTTPQDIYFARHPIYVTTPDVTDRQATVSVQAEVANFTKQDSLTLEVDIRDAGGATVARQTETVKFNRRMRTNELLLTPLTVDQPRLWSCEEPNLYTAVVTVYDQKGRRCDQVKQRFGIRSVEFSPLFGMKLNGKKVLLKGNANHHTLGALGAAAYPAAMKKRLQLLKDFGFNHIRTSHNPYSTSFLDLCDEMGILVVDELYDKWLEQYAGGRVPWTSLWPYDLPEWTKRDRNHPSVVMWSLGNELQTYPQLPFGDWGVTPFRMMKPVLLRYDNTRPITVAMHPRGRSWETDSLPAPLVMETDIAAYNYRYMYFPGDARRFPQMIFYQSEAATANMGPNFYEMNRDKVVGLAYWGQIDYLGESQGWPAKGWAQGAFDLSLQPKPIAYLLRSMFKEGEEDVVHLAVVDEEGDNRVWNDVKTGTARMSENWNRKNGQKLKIQVYTNADEVELFVNHKSYGTQRNPKDKPASRGKLVWKNVKYKKGYVEAVARNNGKIVARHRVETTGKAARLKAETDNSHWKADGQDLQHIRITATDSKGRRVWDAMQPLHFSVEGDARIVAVDNGDITSEELSVGNSRRLFRGTALVILRAGKKAGDVTLHVKAANEQNGKNTRLKDIDVKMKTE